MFVKGKVFINGGGRYAGSTCTNEMSYDVIGSGGLSLEVAPKITVKPAPPYGKAEAGADHAASLAGGLSGQMNKAGLERCRPSARRSSRRSSRSIRASTRC